MLTLLLPRIQSLRADDSNPPLGRGHLVRIRLFIIDGHRLIANNVSFFQSQLRRPELVLREKRARVRAFRQQLLIERHATLALAANLQFAQGKIGIDRPQFQHQLAIERHRYFFLLWREKIHLRRQVGNDLDAVPNRLRVLQVLVVHRAKLIAFELRPVVRFVH